MIAANRKKYRQLELQFIQLEELCESELKKAAEHFQHEQKLVTQNAQIRQVKL